MGQYIKTANRENSNEQSSFRRGSVRNRSSSVRDGPPSTSAGAPAASHGSASAGCGPATPGGRVATRGGLCSPYISSSRNWFYLGVPPSLWMGVATPPAWLASRLAMTLRARNNYNEAATASSQASIFLTLELD